MKWIKGAPTKTGWHWVRFADGSKKIVLIIEIGKDGYIKIIEQSMEHGYYLSSRKISNHATIFEPIEEPEE